MKSKGFSFEAISEVWKKVDRRDSFRFKKCLRGEVFVRTLELLKRAEEGGYAVGGFNVWNLESALALFEAAEESSSPVVFNIPEKGVKLFPSGALESFIQFLGKESRVPLTLNLDTGKTFEICAQCIQLGRSEEHTSE